MLQATITLSLSYKALSTDSANSQSDRQDDGIPLVGGTQSATPTTRPSGSARGGETSLPNRPLNLQVSKYIRASCMQKLTDGISVVSCDYRS